MISRWSGRIWSRHSFIYVCSKRKLNLAYFKNRKLTCQNPLYEIELIGEELIICMKNALCDLWPAWLLLRILHFWKLQKIIQIWYQRFVKCKLTYNFCNVAITLWVTKTTFWVLLPCNRVKMDKTCVIKFFCMSKKYIFLNLI